MWASQFASLPDFVRPLAVDLLLFENEASNPVEKMQVPPDFSIADFAEKCNQFLDRQSLTGPVVVCGLSMGGYVAFEFWNRYPDRVKALILCDTRAAADTRDGAAARRAIADRARREGTAAIVEPMLEKLLCSNTLANKPDVVQNLKQIMYSVSAEAIYVAQNAMATRTDFTKRLPEINVPCLLIVGEEDSISTPQEMRAMAEKIPRSELAIISEAGHLPPMENALQFNEKVAQFLSTLE
jgi:3-oxoadipate enol-lactonase